MDDNCGVYKIKIGNFIYIGSSKNLIKRKNNHLSKFQLNSHYNNKLQSATSASSQEIDNLQITNESNQWTSKSRKPTPLFEDKYSSTPTPEITVKFKISFFW
jgi:hypothetical protein